MNTATGILTALVLMIPASQVVADDSSQLLKDALSAAPVSLRNQVTVMDWDNNLLQEGSSNYVCFPTPPTLQGTAPMCLDGPWQKWAAAWMSKQPFTSPGLGISYMLAGDEGASNIDPYAKGKTDDNDWVKEGPHLMVIVPDAKYLDSLPTDPHNGGPYVMWKGTDYAHIMVPVRLE